MRRFKCAQLSIHHAGNCERWVNVHGYAHVISGEVSPLLRGFLMLY
jgi:hypothetical protein